MNRISTEQTTQAVDTAKVIHAQEQFLHEIHQYSRVQKIVCTLGIYNIMHILLY